MTKKSLSCEEVIERLLPFLDREIDPATAARIEHHLESCRGCYSRAQFERKLKAKVAETGQAQAPDSLRRRIKDLIERF